MVRVRARVRVRVGVRSLALATASGSHSNCIAWRSAGDWSAPGVGRSPIMASPVRGRVRARVRV